ncbi:hypothetical protein F9K81_11680 [Brucella anthropi]|uniref:hypothetical protein n=1 Tax=Brucella anthropi TaxID=529 RepID=UPI00124E4CA9|nr:hypothetical protein [Brucella anthropi]KAB2758003.1 hypothetical protein F9K81_11680 [Brucella anthropi]
MADKSSSALKPITAERIERAMDVLAMWIIKLGVDGEKCIPIYDRLETELRALKHHEQRMQDIQRRAIARTLRANMTSMN